MCKKLQVEHTNMVAINHSDEYRHIIFRNAIMNSREGHKMFVKSSAVIHKGKLYFHVTCTTCGGLTAYIESTQCRLILNDVDNVRSLYVDSVEKN